MKNMSIVLLEEGDDQPAEIKGFLRLVAGCRVARFKSPADLLPHLRREPCDIILTLQAGRQERQELVRRIREVNGGVPVIVLARQAGVEEAVEAMRTGAFDYCELALGAEHLLRRVRQAVGGEAADIAPPAVPEGNFGNIIGESKKMLKVFSLIEKVCDTDTTVLIQGESGTGKELIAQALHYHGDRRAAPFVPVNCGAIPGELLESELFGHEKGAFTHAIRTRIGRFEMADGGTVFLDEIAEMSPALQVKILRVLQERQFERIGGSKTIQSDFRVIAATNRNLEEEVRGGRFREDLYYRLNVIPIEAPPLRERQSDISLLVDYFIDKFNRSKRKRVAGVESGVLARLRDYAWPGNVRELENVIERMVILAQGDRLELDDLPERIRGAVPLSRSVADLDEIPEQGFFLNEVVSEFEKRLICRALDQTAWVKNRAAKLLNVNRTTLIEKMKRYQIVKQEPTA